MKDLIVAGLLAAALSAGVVAGEKEKFVAHEWGTFTSVQGQDGAQLEWNPYVVAELPRFVYDRNRPNHENNRMDFALFAAKSAFMAKQRMETPVIYFYSPEKKSVDVRVDFPSGLMTEWYPHATSCDAQRTGRPEAKTKGSFLEWKGIEITGSQEGAAELPVEKAKSHYYPARETEASILQIKNEAKGTTEREKFLFYRGVGHFEAPLKVTLANDGSQLNLLNAGKETLKHVMVLRVENGKGGRQISARIIGDIDGGKDRVVQIDQLLPTWTKKGGCEPVLTDLRRALEKEGLFAAEANAMVKTWEDSWFDETGTRVLYVLGKNWTDQTLPLSISPAPESIARVMVGRAEVIPPSVEIALRNNIVEYANGNPAAREAAINRTRSLDLGRFTDAVIRQLIKKNPGQEFSKAAFELGGKSAQPPETKPVALN